MPPWSFEGLFGGLPQKHESVSEKLNASRPICAASGGLAQRVRLDPLKRVLRAELRLSSIRDSRAYSLYRSVFRGHILGIDPAS